MPAGPVPHGPVRRGPKNAKFIFKTPSVAREQIFGVALGKGLVAKFQEFFRGGYELCETKDVIFFSAFTLA